MNEYMKKLEYELKRLVSKKTTVTVKDNNYVINIRGNKINIPLINSTTVRKNNIKSK